MIDSDEIIDLKIDRWLGLQEVMLPAKNAGTPLYSLKSAATIISWSQCTFREDANTCDDVLTCYELISSCVEVLDSKSIPQIELAPNSDASKIAILREQESADEESLCLESLKSDSGHPLFAAMILFKVCLAYIAASKRTLQQEQGAQSEMPSPHVRFAIQATPGWYTYFEDLNNKQLDYQFGWLEYTLTKGLQKYVDRHLPQIKEVSFAFEEFCGEDSAQLRYEFTVPKLIQRYNFEVMNPPPEDGSSFRLHEGLMLKWMAHHKITNIDLAQLWDREEFLASGLEMFPEKQPAFILPLDADLLRRTPK